MRFDTLSMESLTLETWSSWFTSNMNTPMYDRVLEELFDKLSKSPELVDSFLSYPLQLKKRITQQLECGVEARDIFAFTELCYKALEAHPSHVWLSEDGTNIMKTVRRICFPSSDKFLTEARNFNTLHASKIYKMHSLSRAHLAAPWILALLYSEQNATEGLANCRKSQTPVSIRDTISLVQNWREFKEYPIEWSLTLLNNEDKDSND